MNELTSVTINLGNERKVEVHYPEGEYQRITNIFRDNEYRLPDVHSHEGTQTVVDIGANVGMFALYYLTLYPDSKIYCFEPVKEVFDVLQRNTMCYNGQTDIFCYGLYNKAKQVTFNTYKNTGMSTIKSQPLTPTGETSGWVKDAGSVFDDLNLKHIDVLKIDTEGCEVEILESLNKRVNNIDYIICEYHSESDRRRIDELLPMFTVADVRGVHIQKGMQIGLVKYMRTSFLQEVG